MGRTVKANDPPILALLSSVMRARCIKKNKGASKNIRVKSRKKWEFHKCIAFQYYTNLLKFLLLIVLFEVFFFPTRGRRTKEMNY